MRLVAALCASFALACWPAAALAQQFPGPACSHIFEETGVPELDGDNANSADDTPSHTPVCREGYALLHNNTTHVPDWVAEDITTREISGSAERKNNFAVDPETPAGARLADYRDSGFDRGHQAPAGDFKRSQALMDETFYLSNMAPQVGECFNRGIWKNLEDDIREWIRTRKRLIVFTGPIYPKPVVTIGDLVSKKSGVKVAVPKSFYKVVYHPKTGGRSPSSCRTRSSAARMPPTTPHRSTRLRSRPVSTS